MAEPVRVKRIEVKGLFGLYDHTIDLKLEDRVTILHGPNGIGKTALLRMVKAAIEGDTQALAERPFGSFRMELSDGGVLEVKPLWSPEGHDGPWPPTQVGFQYTADGQSFETAFNIAHPFLSFRPDWMIDLTKQFPVRMVNTQRLTVADRSNSSTVDWIAEDLATRISLALAAYANETQEQSRTFLQRVLRANGGGPDLENIRARVRTVQAELDRLSALGLLQGGAETPTPPLTDDEIQGADSGKLAMMVQYVADQEVALGTFRDVANRLELLERSLASKLQDKVVRPAQSAGLIATNKKGARIPLSALSSGEQHEIVLFYEMLFLSPEGTLVLIDEPEISMHLLWQKQFVADVVEIAKLVKLDVLIATHSPYIVSERADLMVPLTSGEP